MSALAGRVALVTGGGRGIGRAVALALAAAGARLVLAGRTEATLSAVAAEVAALGRAGASAPGAQLEPPVHVEHVDVADPVSVEAGLDGIARAGLAVDILVNNAGIAESASFARTDLAFWQRHLAINATGPFLLCRALLPGMLERRWGRIVNVASTAGLDGAPYIAAYAASKHALVGLTRSLAAETAGTGVTVNAVCPGFTETDIVRDSARRIQQKTGRSFEAALQALARANASGRLIQPEESRRRWWRSPRQRRRRSRPARPSSSRETAAELARAGAGTHQEAPDAQADRAGDRARRPDDLADRRATWPCSDSG